MDQKMLLILIAALVFLVSAAVAVWYFFFRTTNEEPSSSSGGSGGGAGKPSSSPGGVPGPTQTGFADISGIYTDNNYNVIARFNGTHTSVAGGYEIYGSIFRGSRSYLRSSNTDLGTITTGYKIQLTSDLNIIKIIPEKASTIYLEDGTTVSELALNKIQTPISPYTDLSGTYYSDIGPDLSLIIIGQNNTGLTGRCTLNGRTVDYVRPVETILLFIDSNYYLERASVTFNSGIRISHNRINYYTSLPPTPSINTSFYGQWETSSATLDIPRTFSIYDNIIDFGSQNKVYFKVINSNTIEPRRPSGNEEVVTFTLDTTTSRLTLSFSSSTPTSSPIPAPVIYTKRTSPSGFSPSSFAPGP